MNYFFKTEGCKEDGNYKIYECRNGQCDLIGTIKDRKIGGLKEARQRIGQYLKSKGHPPEFEVPHQCVKPGRDEKKNPWHTWTVEDYLNPPE